MPEPLVSVISRTIRIFAVPHDPMTNPAPAGVMTFTMGLSGLASGLSFAIPGVTTFAMQRTAINATRKARGRPRMVLISVRNQRLEDTSDQKPVPPARAPAAGVGGVRESIDT